jgi:hypothetical protein
LCSAQKESRIFEWHIMQGRHKTSHLSGHYVALNPCKFVFPGHCVVPLHNPAGHHKRAYLRPLGYKPPSFWSMHQSFIPVLYPLPVHWWDHFCDHVQHQVFLNIWAGSWRIPMECSPHELCSCGTHFWSNALNLPPPRALLSPPSSQLCAMHTRNEPRGHVGARDMQACMPLASHGKLLWSNALNLPPPRALRSPPSSQLCATHTGNRPCGHVWARAMQACMALAGAFWQFGNRRKAT